MGLLVTVFVSANSILAESYYIEAHLAILSVVLLPPPIPHAESSLRWLVSFSVNSRRREGPDSGRPFCRKVLLSSQPRAPCLPSQGEPIENGLGIKIAALLQIFWDCLYCCCYENKWNQGTKITLQGEGLRRIAGPFCIWIVHLPWSLDCFAVV